MIAAMDTENQDSMLLDELINESALAANPMFGMHDFFPFSKVFKGF